LSLFNRLIFDRRSSLPKSHRSTPRL